VKQQDLFTPIPLEKFDLLTREEAIAFAKLQQQLNESIIKDNERLRSLYEELKQKSFLVEEQFINIKNKLFGRSSEKESKSEGQTDSLNTSDKKKDKKQKIQLPSLRYPNAPLIERHVELEILPQCSCCGAQMHDSGMTEDSEFLTVVPAQFMVVQQRRHKYSCGKCYSNIKTAPAPPTIKSGSSYSDEMKIDVALSKYGDLIPIERYSSIAGRAGLSDLPPQSLIESTHHLADFTKGAYGRLEAEALAALVLNADETTHRMLEGDKKANWYLWGFSTPKTSYFEIHDTRSGDVASDLLKKSKCEFLVSDVFSGYGKAVKDTNEFRRENKLPPIKNVYCNAHARRKFKEAQDGFPDEAQYFIDKYKEIYRLEDEIKEKSLGEVLILREQMAPVFENMKTRAIGNIAGYSSKSSIGKAMSYFLKNYVGFTLFLKNPGLPIDNNSQERLLRSPVVGRKTWYGTHSRRGAETAAILFSLVGSCKLNKINPREYFKNLVQDLHQGKEPYTPKEYKNL